MTRQTKIRGVERILLIISATSTHSEVKEGRTNAVSRLYSVKQTKRERRNACSKYTMLFDVLAVFVLNSDIQSPALEHVVVRAGWLRRCRMDPDNMETNCLSACDIKSQMEWEIDMFMQRPAL